MYLGDGEIAVVNKNKEMEIRTISNVSKTPFCKMKYIVVHTLISVILD